MLLLLFVMACLFIVGIEWGSITVESSFLNQVGVAFLPFVFAGNALVSIVAIAIYTVFADQVDNRRLLIAISAIGVAAIGAGLLMLAAGMSELAYTVLYLVFVGVLNTFALHWWTFVNDFYDIRAAKRIVPVLASSNRVASGVAGLTVPLLNRSLTPGGIIFIWMSTLAAVAGLAWLLPRLLRGRMEQDGGLAQAAPAAQPAAAEQARASFAGNVREGFRYVAQSAFLRWMALATLVLTLLLTFLNYRTSALLVAELGSQEAIANFVGLVTGIANFVMLPVQLLVLSRLVARIGLGSATLIYPVVTFGITAALVAVPGKLTAGLAYFDRSTLRTTFQSSLEALLYNAVPVRVKGRARAFISGLVVPVGTILGGALLLLTRGAAGEAQAIRLVSLLLLVCSAAYLLISLVIRRQYQRALIEMLEQEDYSFLLTHTAGSLKVTDAAGLRWLAQKLEAAQDSPGVTAFLAQLIARVGGNEAVDILHKAALRGAGGPAATATILDVLAGMELRQSDAATIFQGFVDAPDDVVRRSAVAGLTRQDAANGLSVAKATALLADPDPGVRALALALLLRSPQAAKNEEVQAALDRGLDSADRQERVQVVHALARAADPQALHRLIGLLADGDDAVRTEAAVAAQEALASGTLPPELARETASALFECRLDAVERVRIAAVAAAGWLGGGASFAALAQALSDPSPAVRMSAADALAVAGAGARQVVQPLLESPDVRLRAMASMAVMRMDRHHTPRGLQASSVDIHACMTAILQESYHCQTLQCALAPLRSMPGVQLLLRALQEHSENLAGDVFMLLGIGRPADQVAMIAGSLRSENTRTRANAVEALEGLCPAHIAALVAPLVDPSTPASDLQRIEEMTWDTDPVSAGGALAELATLNPTVVHGGLVRLRMLAAYAVGELQIWAAKPTAYSAETGPATAVGIAGPWMDRVLQNALRDPAPLVREAATAGQRALVIRGDQIQWSETTGPSMLTTMERMIFLKEVSFFAGMTVEQLEVLAGVCEEAQVHADARLYETGDPGGALYVIVEGKVAIEREAQRRGSSVRLATLGPRGYFGEMNLFNDSPRGETAIALQETHILRVRREPIVALCRQQPDLALALVNVLSQRLAEITDQIAGLTRTRPRELHQFFDKLA